MNKDKRTLKNKNPEELYKVISAKIISSKHNEAVSNSMNYLLNFGGFRSVSQLERDMPHWLTAYPDGSKPIIVSTIVIEGRLKFRVFRYSTDGTCLTIDEGYCISFGKNPGVNSPHYDLSGIGDKFKDWQITCVNADPAVLMPPPAPVTPTIPVSKSPPLKQPKSPKLPKSQKIASEKTAMDRHSLEIGYDDEKVMQKRRAKAHFFSRKLIGRLNYLSMQFESLFDDLKNNIVECSEFKTIDLNEYAGQLKKIGEEAVSAAEKISVVASLIKS